MRLPRSAPVGAGLVALALTGCGATVAAGEQPPATTAASHPGTPRRATLPAVRPRAPRSAIDRLTRTARARYSEEVNGVAVHTEARRIAADPVLLRDLRTGHLAVLRTYVTREFHAVWYHQHASRVRIVRGSRVLADAGVPFVVRPSARPLRSGGRPLGTLQVSIQDVVGYVRYLRRNDGVDVVVRGRGAAHVRSSLAGAARARLPASGTATIGGRRYQVRSFHEAGLAGESLTVWVLRRG